MDMVEKSTIISTTRVYTREEKDADQESVYGTPVEKMEVSEVNKIKYIQFTDHDIVKSKG